MPASSTRTSASPAAGEGSGASTTASRPPRSHSALIVQNGRMNDRPRVVIVGAGFGGLYAAKALRRAPVGVTLVDRRNHHLFQPLLYQVATAA